MSRRLTDTEFLEALDDLCVDAILAMTPEDLHAEIIDEGGDPDAMAAQVREAGLRAIRECRALAAEARQLAEMAARAREKAKPAGLPACGSFWS
ncbi:MULTISPECIES: hypothetical protein [Methylobacterium]|uniref:Uncharacterized protein n=1 Tax=Methylobacterium aquaticum TaxID=270351 RepID=A0A0C6F8Q5_9HYPH|nr:MULTISPECIES: hypothetical protein [Methylobacterium]NGM36179.1 hypothetical protein [Methylobacterium sp. DB0501]BAQ49176.1 hypothetical protein Maq22A_1p34555 [Methylobacterium aquaticum]